VRNGAKAGQNGAASTLTPPDPQILTGTGYIRWMVRRPASYRSLTWLVKANRLKDDVYIGACQMMGTIKLSLPLHRAVSSVGVDLGAGGGQDVPSRAELIEALAVGVSGGVVAGVVVERVPGVGQLG
jgi:hypothetical protein